MKNNKFSGLRRSDKTLGVSLFHENRLIKRDAPPEGTEARESFREGKAAQLIRKIHNLEHIEGGDKPETILKDNPSKKYLLDMAEGFRGNYLKFNDIEHSDGYLTLKYPEKTGIGEYVITDLEYVALFWLEIRKAMEQIFEKQGWDKSIIDQATGKDEFVHLNGLALALSKDRDSNKISDSMLEAVETEFKLPELAAQIRHEGAEERTKLRGKAEREKFKQDEKLPEVPRDLVLDKAEFIKIVDSGDEQNSLDPIKIAAKRENYQINAKTWDHASPEGLRVVYRDCERVLGKAKISSRFYRTLFATLANAADATKNRYLNETGEDYVSWFKDPLQHREQLMALPADRNFVGGEQFVRAYEHLHYLQSEILNSQDLAHVATLAKQEGLDRDPVAGRITDFAKRNLEKFQKAIRERDYATAGLYAVGIWALYKSIKKLSGGKDSKITKWLMYGVAAYAGHRFLQNAGYDVLKMAGFKDKDYEVSGTPFEVMEKFVQGKPEYKEYDYSVAFRMSEVKLTTLQKLLEKTNKKGDFFIHPKEFPGIFPDLAKEWSFEMGLGEKGLGDSEGMSNKKLSAAQREYVRVGKNIYLTAVAMQDIYDKTLYRDHPDYKGIPYEEALKDPVRKMGKVRHLLWAAREYTNEEATRFFSEKSTEQAEEHMEAIFEGKDSSLIVEEAMGGGHYSGYLRGFPVVFVRDKDSYKIYLKNNYGDLRNPGGTFVRIPIEGAERGAMADKAIEAVDHRMEELMNPLQLSGGRVLSRPAFRDGAWQTEVKLPGSGEFKVAGETRKGILRPREDGKGVTFLVPGTPVRINIDSGIDKQYEASLAVIPKITNQREFYALKVFSNGRRLRIEDPTPGDKKLTLLIGRGRHKLELEFDPGTDKFAIAGGQKIEELIKSPAFRKDYLEALTADDLFELNETANELKKLIKESCPEKFLAFFFKALSNQSLRGPLSGFNTDALSGTIPDNFTNVLIDTKKQEAFSKLYRAMEGASTFQDVETLRKDVLADMNTEFGVLYDDISRQNRSLITAGEEWQRMEFMLKVVDRIRNAGAKSTQYSLARVDLEYAAYNMNLPGLATLSDFNESSHFAVGKLLNVFTFHTAYLDTPDIDNLTYPPTPNPAFAVDPTRDPELRGHYILNYMAHVKDRIVNEAPKITHGRSLSPDLIPDPTDPRWRIKDFKDWLRTEGRYDALDPLDNMPAFEHDLKKHKEIDPAGNLKKPEHTGLDLELKKRYLEAIDMLKVHMQNDLNWEELNKYLDNKASDEKDIGLFNIYKNPTTGQPHSKIWEYTDSIAQTAGTRRSVQIRLMNHRINKFYDFVFTAKKNGKLRFFIESPGLWEKIKKGYYKIRYKLNI